MFNLQLNSDLNQKPASLMHLSFMLGNFFICFLGITLLITTALFFANITISAINIVLAFILSSIITFIYNKIIFNNYNYVKIFLLLISIILLIMISFIIFSSFIYDTSYDGQWYHQKGIIDLIEGWNPIYQAKTNQISWDNFSEIALTQVSRFPKESWLCIAALYKITNNLESCKAINFFLIISSFFLSFSAICIFINQYSYLKAIIISLLVALNPISIYQSLSFYVDGQLASLISCILALMLLLYFYSNWIIGFSLIMCLVLLINIKFTGLIFTFAFGFLFSIFFYFLKRDFGKKIMKLYAAGIVAGVLFVGYNPYIINTLSYRNPFYPIFSNEIINVNRPVNFHDFNTLERFIYSILSTSANPLKSERAYLKIPFSVSLNEIKVYGETDVRTGGFGPFFGGAFIVAIISLVLSWAYNLSHAKTAVTIAAILFISALIIPELWWARFVPQLWLIPVISVILLLLNENILISRITGWFLIIILSINILSIGPSYVFISAYRSNKVNEMLTPLAHQSSPVLVYFGWPSAKMKFQKMGINYEEVVNPENLGAHFIKIPYTFGNVLMKDIQ